MNQVKLFLPFVMKPTSGSILSLIQKLKLENVIVCTKSSSKSETGLLNE